jgi:Holliday junction resolvase YEN1
MRLIGCTTMLPKSKSKIFAKVEILFKLETLARADVAGTGKPYRGIEKNIFYRICHLLTLNIHLLFVFDSLLRPPKRGRRHYKMLDPRESADIKKVLDAFRIPYHVAIGEAEVECVRLQQLGVVDAVWSQDSDCLLFGCELLLHDNRIPKDPANPSRAKKDTVKDRPTVKMIRGSDISTKHGMDRDGLLLFAMLCGGDFNPQGLKNCGPDFAARAIRNGVGEGLSACRTQEDCQKWRETFIMWLEKQETSQRVDVDDTFPDIQILSQYNRPAAHSDTQLQGLHCLSAGWGRPIDEPYLFSITGPYFNIWGKGYSERIGPILLTRWLVERDPSLPREHSHHIQFVGQRITKGAAQASQPLLCTRKVRFSPFRLTSIVPQLEAEWTARLSDFNPSFLVESEIPTYLLERVLPSEGSNRARMADKSPGKRAVHTDIDGDEGHSIAQKRARTTDKSNRAQHDTRSIAGFLANATHHSTSAQAGPSAVIGSTSPGNECISLLSDSDEISENEQLAQAIALSLQSPSKSLNRGD